MSAETVKSAGDAAVYTLVSSDGQEFEISKKILDQSKTLKEMALCCGDDDSKIQIKDMDGEVLKMIIGFCRHFENEPEYIPPKAGDPERYIPTADDWEMQYLFISHDMLLQIIKGADFLNIPRLIDACCYRLSLMIQGRGVSEIRKIFMIENDFSPEEEEKMRREHIWYDCPLPEHPNFDA